MNTKKFNFCLSILWGVAAIAFVIENKFLAAFPSGIACLLFMIRGVKQFCSRRRKDHKKADFNSSYPHSCGYLQ